jgi:hypothetical protein
MRPCNQEEHPKESRCGWAETIDGTRRCWPRLPSRSGPGWHRAGILSAAASSTRRAATQAPSSRNRESARSFESNDATLPSASQSPGQRGVPKPSATGCLCDRRRTSRSTPMQSRRLLRPPAAMRISRIEDAAGQICNCPIVTPFLTALRVLSVPYMTKNLNRLLARPKSDRRQDRNHTLLWVAYSTW